MARVTGERAALIQLAALAAERVDAGGQAAVATLLRRLAAELAAPASQPGRCRGCAGPLTGRQRDWCTEACRSRWRRRAAA